MLEAPGREEEEAGHTTMVSLARQLPQNQKQMAGRFPNPSFESDCPGQKGLSSLGGEGVTFHPRKRRRRCPLNSILCLGLRDVCVILD